MSKTKEAVRRFIETLDKDGKISSIPASPFPRTALSEVASCLPFSGKAKPLKEMDAAVKKGARQRKRQS